VRLRFLETGRRSSPLLAKCSSTNGRRLNFLLALAKRGGMPRVLHQLHLPLGLGEVGNAPCEMLLGLAHGRLRHNKSRMDACSTFSHALRPCPIEQTSREGPRVERGRPGFTLHDATLTLPKIPQAENVCRRQHQLAIFIPFHSFFFRRRGALRTFTITQHFATVPHDVLKGTTGLPLGHRVSRYLLVIMFHLI
jgi:hypothetical protein